MLMLVNLKCVSPLYLFSIITQIPGKLFTK